MVERGQVYLANDGRHLRVARLLPNGIACVDNTVTGRTGHIPVETLEKGGAYKLLEGVR
jgi:hypothetical protein